MAIIPPSWGALPAGKEELDWILYDGQKSTTTANTKLNFFKQTEAANGLKNTNMSKANELPSSEDFLVKKIFVTMGDVSGATDEPKILDKAFFEFLVNNKRMLVSPVRAFMHESFIMPAGVTQAVDHAVGKTLELENYIHIPGGVNFAFDLTTGDTAAATSTQITVHMQGIRRRGKS